jgi:hypothetical protein
MILRKVVVMGLGLALLGPALAKNPDISPKLTREGARRLGLLVVRVGNQIMAGPAEISLKTDYANRVPKLSKADIYGEDEARLREAIPSYPAYKPSRVPHMEDHYFRNITAPLRDGLRQALTDKGYEVVDVAAAAAGWPRPLAEMNLAAVCAAVADRCDALLVVHYMDLGDSFYDAVNVRRETHGFSGFAVAVAVFDPRTTERLLKYQGSIGVIDALAADPAIQGDPERKDKVSITESRGTSLGIFRGARADRILRYTLDDEEVIGRVVGYACRGYTYTVDVGGSDMKIRLWGIAELMP